MPAANNLVPLMNSNLLFQTQKSEEESREAEFLTALSLINGRKFIQACEILRKLQMKNLTVGSQTDLEKAIEYEIIIADQMNHHSQISEKIFAFQRAVDMSLNKKVKPLAFNINSLNLHQLKEEESYKMLMMIHPYLIKLLLQNINSKTEATRISALKNIEFLIDTIGCSLDQYLIQILQQIIAFYPRNAISQQQTQQSDPQRETLYLQDINDQQNFVIKDFSTIQSAYIQNIKNLKNHILESYLSLMSSLSSNIIHSLFNDIINKSVFIGSNPFENQLATDIRIYLLKFLDKIITICQGDLTLNQQFLDNIILCILPDLKPTSKSGQIGLGQKPNDTLKKQNETISLACQNLWQTLRGKLFGTYSNKGIKQIIEWVFNNLVALAEHSDFLSQAEHSKLTLLLDVVELISNSQSNDKSNGVTDREVKLNSTNADQDNKDSYMNSGRKSLIQVKSRSLHTLELYILINPLLFWLDYSIEKLDRLPLFKIVWRTLNKILISFPNKKLDIDNVTIIMPVLLKINQFCQNSSPPQEMLQFLMIVFEDFKKQSIMSKQLKKFLVVFLKTIASCIPHHLHDEVFQVCEIILQMAQEFLQQEHIQLVIDALIDKYTMRSKAHKKLCTYFISLVLERSLIDIKIQTSLRVQDNNEPPFNQAMAADHQNHREGNEQHQDDIENYEYERESYQYEDDEEEGIEDSVGIHHNHQHAQQHQHQYQQQQQQLQQHQELSSQEMRNQQIRENQSNQDYNTESPISQRVVHHAIPLQINNPPSQWHQNNNQNQVASRPTNIHLNMEFLTAFDKLSDICLFNNNYQHSNDRSVDIINLELYFEKISLMIQIIKAMNQKHIALFQRLLNRNGFVPACVKMYSNQRSTINYIELQEQISEYYMRNCAPKNLYEHPIQIMNNQQMHGIFGGNHNNQTSQSSGGHVPQFNINNREQSRASYMSVNVPRLQPQYGLVPMIGNLGQTHPVLFQGVRLRQHEEVEDELLLNQDIHEDIISDELDLINKERLILIQLYAQIIRISIDQYGITQDAYIQFHTLNMLENLFTNLMPLPNFQNLVIKNMLQRTRNQNPTSSSQHQQAELSSNEIPDLEKMNMIETMSTYMQLMQQQQNISSHSQNSQNYILSEFECFDIKYLHARLQFAMKIWSFLEQSIMQSSWNNIKSICYGVICQLLKIDITGYKSSFQSKLKQLLFPLLSNLLNSKESESKAGGLNILGSFLGLGHDFQVPLFNEGKIKVSDNKSEFRKSETFVSLAIWQQVFNLQEDWDITIREAASVLIQVCAPRESIQHFHSIQKEKYNLKLSSLINTFTAASSQSIRQRQYLGGESGDHAKSIDSMIHWRSERLQNQAEFKGCDSGSDNEEEKQNESNDNIQTDEMVDENYFYADQYNEDQLKEIIAIFKVDYKPPKTLWIEKQGATNNYQFQNGEMVAGQALNYDGDVNMHDVFEDNFVNKLNSKANTQGKIANAFDQYFKSGDDKEKSNANGEGETDYLIFERHFETDKEKNNKYSQDVNGSSKADGNTIDGINQDELGIIDLDEVGDDFDELDDDKLPILKNTYKKKNRPNNSKSVAIGSRSQENQTNQRFQHSHHQQEESEDFKKEIQIKADITKGQFVNIDVKKEETKEMDQSLSFDDLDLIEEDDNTQDDIIEQYENMIANTIKDLNTQLKTQDEGQILNILQGDKIDPQCSRINVETNTKEEDNQSNSSKKIKSVDGAQQLKNSHSPIKAVQHQLLVSSYDKKEQGDTNKQNTIRQINLNTEPKRQSAQISITNISTTTCSNTQNKANITTSQQIASLSQNINGIGQVPQITRKINDPASNLKKTYSSQASKLKSLASLSIKKEQPQKPNTSLNSPGSSSQVKPQSQLQISKNNLQKEANARKRKSDYQRKSELPLSKRQYQSQTSSNQTLDNQSKSLDKYQTTQQPLTNAQKKHQSLMQQAKQVFVSRAKSQSYLNSVMAIGNNSSAVSVKSKIKKGSFNNYIKQENALVNASHFGRNNAHNEHSSNPDKQQSTHKGYFSNDEYESSLQSPLKENKTNKLSISSEDGEKFNYKSSSHKVQRKRKNKTVILSDDEEDEVEEQIKEGEEQEQNEEAEHEEIINDISSQKQKEKPTEMEMLEQDSLGEIGDGLIDEDHQRDHDDDLEEFWSGEESLKGGKQLSCIEEEDENSDRKQHVMVNNFTITGISPSNYKHSQESL